MRCWSKRRDFFTVRPSMSVGKNAGIVTTATGLSQLAQLAALPMIASYASPQIFGSYTLFVGFCSVVAIFAGLRYDGAIVVAYSARQARMASALVATLGIVTALAVVTLGTAAVSWNDYLNQLFGFASVWLAGMYIAANTFLRVAIAWLTRIGRFGWIGAVQFASVSGMVLLQLLLLLNGIAPLFSLIAGFAGGQLLGVIVAAGGPARQALRLAHVVPASLLGAARHFIAFPRYMILYGLNSSMRERAIHFLMGSAGGANELGGFAMAQRLLGTPHGLLHGSLGPALLRHARVFDRPEVSRVAVALMELAILLFSPVFIFVAMNAPSLTYALFGSAWQGLALYLQILALPYLILCCTAFIDRLYEMYGQQRAALRLELGYSLVVLVGITLVGLTGSGTAMAIVFAFVYTLYELLWTYRTFIINGLPRDRLGRLFRFSIGLLIGWLVVNAAVLSLSSLSARLAIVASIAAVTAFVHWRWLGGRELLLGLIGSRR